MTTLQTKFPHEDIGIRYILSDLERWKDEIDAIYLESAFYSSLLDWRDKVAGPADHRDFLATVSDVLNSTKTLQSDLLTFSNRFEGMIECEDIHCETHFINAFREFKAMAEAHLSGYKKVRKTLLLYLKPVT